MIECKCGWEGKEIELKTIGDEDGLCPRCHRSLYTIGKIKHVYDEIFQNIFKQHLGV